jgi:hypothetical protein
VHKEACACPKPGYLGTIPASLALGDRTKLLIRSTTDTMNPRLRIASIAIGLLVSTGATALDVNVVGLFPNKAVVQIDGGALQTLSVGQKTRDNIILLSVDRDGATFDVQGRRVALAIGPARRQTSPPPRPRRAPPPRLATRWSQQTTGAIWSPMAK